jgi:hypothetical protein
MPTVPGGQQPPQDLTGLFAGGIFGLIIGLVMLVVMLWIWGRIFHKAGFSGWLALLLLIPIVNLVLIIWFAFAEWPLERRAKSLMGSATQAYAPATAPPPQYGPPPGQPMGGPPQAPPPQQTPPPGGYAPQG